MTPVSMYLHIPFCQHRCGYCDFNTYAGLEHKIPEYLRALRLEVEKVGQSNSIKPTVHTIYFGGGTPSLIPVDGIEMIVEAIQSSFKLAGNLEMTLEANPGTVSPSYLNGIKELGVNRISFGMQSGLISELVLLERQHDMLDVFDAVRWSRQAGIRNINLDLIYGLPSQQVQDWQTSIETALLLNPDHLSLYSLTIEEGTPMARWQKRGLISPPDEDIAADMYEWAAKRLENAGFFQYEISNWARARDSAILSCRHNLQYWRNLPYFGFGAGAHGYISGVRMANEPSISRYINLCQSNKASFPLGPAVIDSWTIDQQEEMKETMMLGLRLTSEGVSFSDFADRFGTDISEAFPGVIEKLAREGLLKVDNLRLRLTSRGRLLGNRVFREFVGEND